MGINSSNEKASVVISGEPRPLPTTIDSHLSAKEITVEQQIEAITANPASTFTCKDAPVENQRPLKVRVIGAGYSGVYLGIRIPQRLRNVDLKIYEKNAGVGGTWWENRYPGCACDIPSHSYQYTFAPNKSWSGFYAPAEEICEYIDSVATKYGAKRFIHLQHKVTSTIWDDVSKKWVITVQTPNGSTITEEADILIAARGNLNDPAWPEISGLDTFKGKKIHSAAWDQGYDFKNKKIGIIGGGSSSIQIVPELQKIEGTQLSCFVRSKVWISNRFGDETMAQLGWDPADTKFSAERLAEFAKDDSSYLKFRKRIEDDGNLVHSSSIRGSEMQNMFVEFFSKITKDRLAGRPDLLEFFSPTFGVGCRRLTPGPGYLEALTQPNVDFITTGIESINETGLNLAGGRRVDVDVLVCATGFHTSYVPPYPVKGRGGRTVEEKFDPFPGTYLTVGIDDFPNYFMMLGPNSAIGAGSLTCLLEAKGDYIVKCIRKLQKEDYITMTPKKARVDDFTEYIAEYFKKTVYMDDCKSWYKVGGLGDKVSALWPGSILHLMETLRAPRWEDYDYESSSSSESNRLRWLGNGWSMCIQEEEEQGDPSWYLNPEYVDVPPEGEPEKDTKLKARPWSH